MNILNSKRCYRCQRRKLLFFFQKDNGKYKIKSSKDRCLACRKCNIKLSIKNGGVMQREDGKFTFVKMGKLAIIKHHLK